MLVSKLVSLECNWSGAMTTPFRPIGIGYNKGNGFYYAAGCCNAFFEKPGKVQMLKFLFVLW